MKKHMLMVLVLCNVVYYQNVQAALDPQSVSVLEPAKIPVFLGGTYWDEKSKKYFEWAIMCGVVWDLENPYFTKPGWNELRLDAGRKSPLLVALIDGPLNEALNNRVLDALMKAGATLHSGELKVLNNREKSRLWSDLLK